MDGLYCPVCDTWDNATHRLVPDHEMNLVVPNEIFVALAEGHRGTPEFIPAFAPKGWLIKLWPKDRKALREEAHRYDEGGP